MDYTAHPSQLISNHGHWKYSFGDDSSMWFLVPCQLSIKFSCTSGAILRFSILLKDTSTCSSVPPRGAGIRTSDLLISSPPALLTELLGKKQTTTTTTKHSWINIFLWQIVQLYIVFLSHLQYSIMHRKAQQLGRKHFANIFFWQKMNGNIWFFFCPDTKAVLFVFVFRDYLCHFSVFHWFDFSHSRTPAPVMILSAAL